MDKYYGNSNVSNVRVIENDGKSYKDQMGKDNKEGKGRDGRDSKDFKDSKDTRGKGCVDVDSTTLGDYDNTPLTPIGIPGGVVARIPVVLSELTVRFNVMAKINLPELALEIKNIKKRLKITQCTLLQPTNVLFIKGFIRKNIDYTTKKCSNREGVCGELHHCTVDVPFELTTPIDFTFDPAPLLTNTQTEFEYFKVSQLPNKDFAEKDHLLSGDFSEFNQFMVENFNRLPFCELIRARIFEFDEFVGRERPHHDDLPFEEKLFEKIEEKMVIELTIQILQERQVSVPPVAGADIDDDCPF